MAELPVRKRLWYGMGGLTMSLPDLILMQWLLVRYVPPDGSGNLLPPALIGLVLLCGRTTEGLCNPPIGNWSDHCTSRWGRRLPFIRLGLLPFVVVFFLLFNPPVGHMHWINAVYAFVLIVAYAFLYASIVTPYLALLPEITSDLRERVHLATFQSLFIMIGTFVFAGLPLIIERWGWRAFSGVTVVLLVLFYLPVATMVQEKPRPDHANQERLGLWHSIRLALQNRPFRYLVACTALYWFGLNGVIALVPHWTISVLGRSEGDVPKLMVPFLASNIIFFFVFNILSGKFGKYAMMLVTFLLSGLVIAGFVFVGHLPFGSDFAQTALLMALFGAPAAGFMVLPFAVLADVVDYDETRTGRRREAIFFGVQAIFQRAMVGVSALTFTIVPFLGSDGSRVLQEDGWLTFSGTYLPGQAVQDMPEPPAENDEIRMAKRMVRVKAAPRGLDAPWVLTGPEGYEHQGAGNAVLPDLKAGVYAIHWGDIPGWAPPQPQRTPTPFGLRFMALLCALFCVAGFVLFIKYPIRERNGQAVLIN